jgi:hypothetical protein
MSGLELKDFLSPKTLAYPVNQRVETDILYPVSFSQSSVKFVFDRKGILDANSKVRLKLLVPTQAAGGDPESNSAFPIHTGVSAMINRCWLEIGGRRVSTLEKVGDFLTFTNLSYSPEYKKNVLSVQEGVSADIGGATNSTGTVIGLLSAKNSNADVSKHLKLKSTASLSPEFSLPLSRLIPMLKGFQLPLFAIDQEVSITIEFNQNKTVQKSFIAPAQALNNNGIATIDRDACILMADYLYYPDEMMDIAQKIGAPGGYAHLYDEVMTIESTENPIGADPTGILWKPATFSHQLNLAGKTLKSIVVQPVKTPNDLAGVYVANDDQIPDRYNFVIDSKPFYANDVVNSSFKYKEVSSVMERPLSLNAWEYSFDNQTTEIDGNSGGQFIASQSGFSDWTFMGKTQQERTASQSWRGMSLAKESMGVGGRVMSNLPVVFRRIRGFVSGNAYPGNTADYLTSVLVRFFATTGRVLLLKNGQATIVQ